jgi:hypothetical protein
MSYPAFDFLARIALATLLVLSPVARAGAVTLTFDGVTNADVRMVEEDGFQIYITGGNNPHMGDESLRTDVLDWHNAGANADPANVFLVRKTGGNFNLTGFDVLSGILRIFGLGDFGRGSHNVNFTDVAFLAFQAVDAYRPNGTQRWNGVVVDNIRLSLPEPAAVPLPASAGLLAAALALILGRRRAA